MMCKSAGHHFYHTALHQRTCKKDCSIRKDHTLLWLDFFPLLPSLMLLFLPRLVSGLSFKLISTSPLELQPKIHLFHKGWMIFRMILLLCRRFFLLLSGSCAQSIVSWPHSNSTCWVNSQTNCTHAVHLVRRQIAIKRPLPQWKYFVQFIKAVDLI